MFVVHCPLCNAALRLPDEVAGKTIRCLKCQTIILVHQQPAKLDPNSDETTTKMGADEAEVEWDNPA